MSDDDDTGTDVGFECSKCGRLFTEFCRAARHLQSENQQRGFCAGGKIKHSLSDENPNILGGGITTTEIIVADAATSEVAQKDNHVLPDLNQYPYQIKGYSNEDAADDGIDIDCDNYYNCN